MTDGYNSDCLSVRTDDSFSSNVGDSDVYDSDYSDCADALPVISDIGPVTHSYIHRKYFGCNGTHRTQCVTQTKRVQNSADLQIMLANLWKGLPLPAKKNKNLVDSEAETLDN